MTSYTTEIPTSSKRKQVCVLGGRSEGRVEAYKQAAAKLGEELVARGFGLVCNHTAGLVRIVAQAVHKAGGHVTVIPPVPPDNEEAFSEEGIIPQLHKQKKTMAHHADCFIVVPGGLQTMEKFTEVTSWAQLGIHSKPVGLLNVGGYFDSFLAQIDTAVEEGFIQPLQRSLIVFSTDDKELLDKLEKYEPTCEGAIPRHLWEVEDGSSSLTCSGVED